MRNMISIWLQRTQFGGFQQPETIAWNEGILMCQCEQDTRGGWQSIASAFVSRSELILIIHLPLSMMFNCSTYRPVFKWSHPFAVMIPFVNRNVRNCVLAFGKFLRSSYLHRECAQQSNSHRYLSTLYVCVRNGVGTQHNTEYRPNKTPLMMIESNSGGWCHRRQWDEHSHLPWLLLLNRVKLLWTCAPQSRII